MSNPSNESPPEWTILYHMPNGPKPFKGRGEFLRLMLEDKGVKYVNSADNLAGPNGIMMCFRGSHENNVDNTAFPLFYPPAIQHRPPEGEEVLINQVSACMMYIGEQLGYEPKSRVERAKAQSILINAVDYIAEGRSSFHPVQNNMSYHKQKEEGDKTSKEFAGSRMLLWLSYFNNVVRKNPSPQSPVAGGEDVTYADFALFHVLDATASQFNSDFYENAWDKAKVSFPAVAEYYQWMKTRPKLQEYFASDRCGDFAGDSMM